MAYFDTNFAAIKSADSIGDGTSIKVSWYRAYPSMPDGKIAYHIYYSQTKELVYHEQIKYIYNGPNLEVILKDFVPGQSYYFAVRAIEFPSMLDPFFGFPQIDTNLHTYPKSPLRQSISATDIIIPLVDVSEFPDYGVILIGSELISYSLVDRINNNIILSSISDRGYNLTVPRQHSPDGFDGRFTWTYRNIAQIYIDGELKDCDREFYCLSRFEYPHEQYRDGYGYHQKTEDILNVDLSESDSQNEGYPMYDYAGWHRIDPVKIISGDCTGSYIGGEMYCADDETGVGRVVRGISIQDRMMQREEMLWRMTGVRCVLLQSVETGIRCSCYLASNMHPNKRCPKCHGNGFIVGYVQYFNPREADGRMLLRFGPMEDDIKLTEAGFDSECQADVEAPVSPTIKGRDIIIKYGLDDVEEFRYEVISVNRNNSLLGQQGMQKVKVGRIRKTDPLYKIIVFANTSMYPQWLTTEQSLANGKMPQHTHDIRRNEKYSYTWAQNTTKNAGHNHQLIWSNDRLLVLPVLDHTHDLIIPS
jgi:hypothetical protein